MQRNSHAFSQGDVFNAYDLNKLKFKEGSGTAREMKVKYKYRDKRFLIAQVFWYFIRLVLEDLIKEGTTFHFPNKSIAMLTWKRIDGEEFVKSYKSGRFDNIDFLSSNFTLYVPIFKYFYRGKFREKSVIIDNSLKEIRDEKVNNGFKYC